MYSSETKVMSSIDLRSLETVVSLLIETGEKLAVLMNFGHD